MWCTRWFLPLILLPLPTAPPIFLLLFLLTLMIHAKPCFYCIVLLTTLFVSTCYWSPISLDVPLSTPWAENITTFGQALNSTLSPSYSKPLPPAISPVDRCWCDISTAGFFEPFNTSQWEILSVQKVKDSLEKQEQSLVQELERQETESNTLMPKTVMPAPTARSLSLAQSLLSLLKSRSLPENNSLLQAEPDASNSSVPASKVDRPSLPLFRREYDLRALGVDLVVDFGSSMTA
ncbi:hypothetical protein BDP27DRAFT_1261080 [Rhodocollybia butyracea]|uniref:Uncharacterized protein n=1 Tax=Rhodocollybia butyracea TaxID=206335 RepID=A0A9P5PUJ8_9AGAR|nr:hypothetical protein BDP27DRAFT_1261080 [Rhodocollybia butyracea]